MDINTRKSNCLKHIVYCHPPGFLATQQLVTDPHAENASCIKKSQIYEKMGQKTKWRKNRLFCCRCCLASRLRRSARLMIPTDRGKRGQGGNKQNRHTHFFVTNWGSQLTFYMLRFRDLTFSFASSVDDLIPPTNNLHSLFQDFLT